MKVKDAQGRWSIKLQGQRIGLFQGWMQALWALPPPRPLTVSVTLLGKDCEWEVGAWKGQIHTKIGPWDSRCGHRHPKLAMHRGTTGSVSHLE